MLANYPIFLSLGGFGLGFVIGWTLYFANRGKAGKLSVSDIAALITAIAGGAVIGFFGKAPDEAAAALAIGFYGFGLFIGFLTYYGLYRKALGEGGDLISLESEREAERPQTRSNPSLKVLESLHKPESLEQPVSGPVATLKALVIASDALGAEYARAWTAARGDEAKRSAISEQRSRLNEFRNALALEYAAALLHSPDAKAFFDELKAQTETLNDEAAKMKNATRDIAKVDEFFKAANGLIGALKDIV